MNHPELVHGLELLPCAIRDGMLYIPHADGNWVSAAKLQPFSLKIIEYWRAEQVEAGRSRAASEPGEVARLAEQLKRSLTFADSHTAIWYHERIDRLANMAPTPASGTQARAPIEVDGESFTMGDTVFAGRNDPPAPLPASSPVAAEGQKAVAESVVCTRCGHENWIMGGKAPCQITEADKRATPTASMADAAEAPKCECGDRLASECDEQWGPNCDMGNNAAHVRVSTVDPAVIDAALAQAPAEAAIVALRAKRDQAFAARDAAIDRANFMLAMTRDAQEIAAQANDRWAAAQKEAAELRKDAERLDWLERSKHFPLMCYSYSGGFDGFTFNAHCRGENHLRLRAAIDTARASLLGDRGTL